jgi:hypothetical protein
MSNRIARRRLALDIISAALCAATVACGGSGGGSGTGGSGGSGGGTGGGGTGGGGGTNPSTPPTVTAVSVNPSTVAGFNGAQGTVTLSAAPTAGTNVALSSNNAAATVPGSISVNSGATTGSFSVDTTPVTSTLPVTIQASLNSTSAAAVLTLTPPPLAAVVRVVSLSNAKRKQSDGSLVDIPGRGAGSLNTCPLVQDGSGQRLDCEIDASRSTSPNGFRQFRYKWRLATVDGDSGNVSTNKYRPVTQNCGFFGGQNTGSNQFVNMRVTVELSPNSGSSIEGVVDGVSIFPAGLCGYGF